MQASFSNHLAGESSPYLLQHARNPVDWYPWNEEALNKAGSENKLMIISIGYAACHWCHVMEKESFEDPGVADLMNQHYVSVKVDREERPDVDQVYMVAAYIISGRGGWPLNVIALPDGKPVFAGTYFPKDQWLYILNYFASAYRDHAAELISQAGSIHRKILQSEKIPITGHAHSKNTGDLDLIFKEMQKNLDSQDGGTIGAPKFPMPVNLEFLLHYGFISGNREAENAVELALDKMAGGGIYDQVGGGFCRYSVDDHWHIPHFEKMLYDNAQLVSIYSRGFLRFRKPIYREVVESTLNFIERELTSPEGLFYASLDADNEKGEGAYYSWNAFEVRELLKEDAPMFMDFFGISEHGNWEEGRNILFINRSPEETAAKFSTDIETFQEKVREGKRKLLESREKRPRPGLDNKIITGWNALMISGYVEAYKAFGEDRYLAIARDAAKAFVNVFDQYHQLFRLHPASSIRKIPAFLDDYAFLIKAFLDLYQVTFDPGWMKKAEILADYSLEHFFDAPEGLFFFTPDTSPALIDRRKEISDNVIPSSNSQMALNLLILGHLTGKDKWIRLALSMLGKMDSRIRTDPSFHANWAILLIHRLIPPYEIAIIGDACIEFLHAFHQHYFPQVLFYGGIHETGNEMLKGKGVEGKTMIYICRDKTCSDPLDRVEEAVQRILPTPGGEAIKSY